MKTLYKRKNLFLIVDFGASQNHTHHRESVFSFAELISRTNSCYEIWIPAGSEICHSNLPIKYCLLPGFNPIGLNLRKPSTWVSALHGKLHNFSNKTNLRSVLNILAYLNSLHFFFLLLFKKIFYKNIRVIFTTMCAFSFRSLCMLEAGKINIEAYCRLTNTSERRGKLSEMINFEDFIKTSNTFTNVRIRFGVETNAYMKKIGLKDDNRAFISKFPSKQSIQDKSIDLSQFTISFLGHPTKSKGQQHMLPIVKEVGSNNPEINWQIHLAKNDRLLPKLKEINENIKILEGKISSKSMEEALFKSSLICLPYDIDAFKYNSSSMMYQSTDYLVPILTLSGSAFAEEVDEFNCGLVADDIEDLIIRVSRLDLNVINTWIEGCKRYNIYRNQSNCTFLNL